MSKVAHMPFVKTGASVLELRMMGATESHEVTKRLRIPGLLSLGFGFLTSV